MPCDLICYKLGNAALHKNHKHRGVAVGVVSAWGRLERVEQNV